MGENLVNVIDPDTLEVGSLPASELPQALDQGFQQASPEQVQQFINQQKYGTAGQQLLTGIEGAASAATFGVSTGVERALGVNPEDIIGRREENPLAHGIGQGVGIAGTAFIPGGGTAGLLSKAGQASSEALGLTGTSALSKIGSAAVKGAAETALVTSGDEVSKMLASDPNQSVETALTNVGLSTFLGGGLGGAVGSVQPLWDATMGPKVGSVLKAISDRVGGVEGKIPDAIEEIISKAGIEVTPEVKAAMQSNPEMQAWFQQLQESTTSSGMQAQAGLKNFRKQATEKIASVFGKTSDDIVNLANMSDYEIGAEIKDQLAGELKKSYEPIKEIYGDIEKKFKGVEFTRADKDLLSESIFKLNAEKGYNLAKNAPEAKLLNQIMDDMANINTLDDLKKYTSLIGSQAQKDMLWDFGKEMRNIFREAEANSLESALGKKAPELLKSHAQARAGYKAVMETIDNLNDRLHVGRYSGPESFFNALKEMTPEDIARRISSKKDVELLNTLKAQFPSVSNTVKDYQVAQLLKGSGMRAVDGETLNPKTFFNGLEKLSPEMKKFIMDDNQSAQVDAIKQLLGKIPQKMNTSGTAKTMDALWSKLFGSGLGILTAIETHNPLLGLLVSPLSKMLGRDVPDAIKLGLLKYMGSTNAIDSGGFKAMVDFIQHMKDGENLITKSTKNLFKSGMQVLPQAALPTEKKRDKLDEKLKALQLNPQPLIDSGGKMNHYLPDQGVSMGQTAANAVELLNQMRPVAQKQAPLDTDPEISPEQKDKYNRVLDIAEQPLLVLQHIKDGRLVPEDVQVLNKLYPALYQKLSQKLYDNVIETTSKGNSIPYDVRMSLSLFLGQPLDSTMTSQFILSQQSKQQPQPMPKHSMAALDKMGMMAQTPDQSRGFRRLK